MKIDVEDNSHWISVSDIMSVLMIIFLFISIVYMNNVQKQKKQVKEIAVAYQNTQVALYERLNSEFKTDLKKWGAEIDSQNLSVRFNEPETLFDKGKDTVKDKFKVILRDFFPRYINIMEEFKNDISEIRIEGHTDSDWNKKASVENSYFKNMALSQDRTRAVLKYCLTLPLIKDKFNWTSKKITANGLSSSHLIYNEKGKEDKEKSRRVEFKVKTNAEIKIMSIIETVE